MKILVTGSNGQLGSELQSISDQVKHEFIFTDIEELNICDENEITSFFEHMPVNMVINCAAYTAVDLAEKEIDKAYMINATAPKILSERSRRINASIIHISTDFVFNGLNYKPYTEEDVTAPVNVYGQTKYEGEIRLMKENPKSLILRTSWLYSAFGNNFVKTMLKLGKEKKELNVIFDQVGTPTYAGDLARALLHIVDQMESEPAGKNQWGLYHFSNEGVASWYDFAYEIFRLKKMNITLNPIFTRNYPTPAKRPHYSVMDKSKIKSSFGLIIPHWKESLKKCLSLMK